MPWCSLISFNMGIYSATKNEQIEVNSAGIIAIPPSVPPPDEALLDTKKPFGFGFAFILGQTALGEDLGDNQLSGLSEGATSENIDITDEELALLGPPWAKEGILSYRYYKESPENAKSKEWVTVFAVVQKGEHFMFKFGNNGGTRSDGPVGDGKWWENAKSVGQLQLAHSIAQVQPLPGCSDQRPNCMALTLANGSVYFFQAGTEELTNEWVSTCNYWAARRSKEPLAGGNLNEEYGWNRVSSSSDMEQDTASFTSKFNMKSLRNWGQSRTVRNAILDWKPPASPTVASTRDEGDQLKAMGHHASILKAKLDEHSGLQQSMIALHKHHPAGFAKAQDNWHKRANYLQAEVFKYRLYAKSLRAAINLRLAKQQASGPAGAVGGLLVPTASPSDARSSRGSSTPQAEK